MKFKSACLGLAVLLAVILGILILLLVGMQYLRQRQQQIQIDYLPPSIQITSPQDGVSAPVGNYLSIVSAFTFEAQNPVKTVEWWLDGTRLESHPVQAEAGALRAYDTFNLLIPSEGTHMLLARAINARGVIGTSDPLTFQGSAGDEEFLAVKVKEGDTLESLAADHDTDAATLQDLNPGMGNAPAPGTTVKAPMKPEGEPAATLPNKPPAAGITLVTTSPILQVANPTFLPGFNLLAAVPPEAPTNLQGEVKDCRIKLAWEDNSDIETGYEIWVAAPGAPLKRMVTLEPNPGGTAWFEFQAQGPGYFLYWVEAVNSIGRQGSNVITINTDAGCPAGAPTHLQIDILDIASSSAERVYCYISFNNAPEVRLPLGDGNFIPVKNGHGDLTAWPHSFALSIPQNNTVALSGECWGWAGQTLNLLGAFASSMGSETWDGTPRQMQGGSVAVSLSITSQGPEKSKMNYVNDAGIAEPYNLRLYYDELPGDPKKSHWVLSWEFDPIPLKEKWEFDDIYWVDVNKNEGWHYISRNEPSQSRARFFAYGKKEELVNYVGCERQIQFIVSAYRLEPAPHVRTTGVLGYQTPQCPVHLEVKFDSLEIPWTGEGLSPGPCDELEIYYHIRVNDQTKSFWSDCSFGVGCFVLPLSCGTYTFKELAPDYFQNPDTIWATFYYEEMDLEIATYFYDDDYPLSDDLFAPYNLRHVWKNRADAKAELGCDGKSYTTPLYENDTANSILHYTISMLPNPCNPYPK
ncbi:MAG: LysM peptidoglycan-binding domain-containing protein [Leptolinea sp.]|jgi:LysM repeat protein|nr:LysM peptidoglycan-binding domain-containing protein [Leptolinea sp.]